MANRSGGGQGGRGGGDRRQNQVYGGRRGAPIVEHGGGRAPTGFVWPPPGPSSAPCPAAPPPYLPAVAVYNNPNATGPHQDAYQHCVSFRGRAPTPPPSYALLEQAPFVSETALAPPAAAAVPALHAGLPAAEKAPGLDLPPVAHPSRPGAMTVGGKVIINVADNDRFHYDACKITEEQVYYKKLNEGQITKTQQKEEKAKLKELEADEQDWALKEMTKPTARQEELREGKQHDKEQLCNISRALAVLASASLREWLDLSLNHAMPSSLLILSRAFIVSGRIKPEAVVATLSSLPDEVVDTVGTVLPSEDSVSERRRKLEFLEMQEELMKEEEKKKEKEEKAIQQKEEKAKLKEPEADEQDLSLKEMTEPTAREEEELREGKQHDKEQLCNISRALAVLPSASSVRKERQEFPRLVNQEIGLYNCMIEKEGTDGEEAKRAYISAREEADDSDEVAAEEKVSSALIEKVREWLDLSLDHAMPSSLLILSRAFIVSGRIKPEEAVVATLSSLPDEVVDTVGTVLPSEDSASERRRNLEFLEMQEELIKEEEKKKEKEEKAIQQKEEKAKLKEPEADEQDLSLKETSNHARATHVSLIKYKWRSNTGNQLHMFRFSLKKQGNEARIHRHWMSPSSSKQVSKQLKAKSCRAMTSLCVSLLSVASLSSMHDRSNLYGA